MARITNQETYATKSKIEILAQAKLSAKEEASTAQNKSEIQEIVINQDGVKAAKDFANARKSDGQLQAALLKGQLNDTASRLDQFREGDLKGLQKDAKKFGIEDLGVIKDNLGKDIARHEGPGIKDMYKKSKKYEMPDHDPLNGFPKMESAKKGPDMPFKKNDPSLVSKGVKHKKDEGKLEFGIGEIIMLEPEKVEVKPPKLEFGVGEITILEPDKPVKADKPEKKPDKPKKYIDPDQIDSTKIEKPKDPPPTAHDKLGHKVNPLNHDPVIDTENVDVKKLVAEHKGPKKSQIYTDPDQIQETVKVDPANPPRIEENELKNTGNPNDPRVQSELPKSGRDKPYTDGDGNANQPQN